MIKTLAEARAYRYNKWAGNPKGNPYKEGYCVFEVWQCNRAPIPYQCQRKAVTGPANLYCKQHDPAEIQRRKAARTAKWEAELALSDLLRDLGAVTRAVELLRSGNDRTAAAACRLIASRLREKIKAMEEK